jgi:hypothetical protein
MLGDACAYDPRLLTVDVVDPGGKNGRWCSKGGDPTGLERPPVVLATEEQLDVELAAAARSA